MRCAAMRRSWSGGGKSLSAKDSVRPDADTARRLLALSAQLLKLGEHGFDVEFFGFLGGGRLLRLRLRRRSDGGGKQRRALRLGRNRLFLGGALHLEVEVDLRAKTERHRVERR